MRKKRIVSKVESAQTALSEARTEDAKLDTTVDTSWDKGDTTFAKQISNPELIIQPTNFEFVDVIFDEEPVLLDSVIKITESVSKEEDKIFDLNQELEDVMKANNLIEKNLANSHLFDRFQEVKQKILIAAQTGKREVTVLQFQTKPPSTYESTLVEGLTRMLLAEGLMILPENGENLKVCW